MTTLTHPTDVRGAEIAAAILRLPVAALDGRPTPARVAAVSKLAARGELPQALADHLALHGRVDDATWALLAPVRP